MLGLVIFLVLSGTIGYGVYRLIKGSQEDKSVEEVVSEVVDEAKDKAKEIADKVDGA